MTMTSPILVDLQPAHTAVIRATIPMDRIRDFFDQVYGEVAQTLGRQGVRPAGPPLAVYFGMPTDTIDLAAGFPTAEAVGEADRVVPLELPAGRAAQAVHEGSYDTLGDTYQHLAAWMTDQGVTPGRNMMWEQYETMPTPGADPSSMRTRITWPLADTEGGSTTA